MKVKKESQGKRKTESPKKNLKKERVIFPANPAFSKKLKVKNNVRIKKQKLKILSENPGLPFVFLS